MKYNFVIAALLGYTQAARFSNQEKMYEYIQTGAEDILEHKGYFDGWPASMEDFPGTNNQNGAFKQAYNRNVPGVFTGDAADDGYYPVD